MTSHMANEPSKFSIIVVITITGTIVRDLTWIITLRIVMLSTYHEDPPDKGVCELLLILFQFNIDFVKMIFLFLYIFGAHH